MLVEHKRYIYSLNRDKYSLYEINHCLNRFLDLLKVVVIISPSFELGNTFVRSTIWHAPVLKSNAGQEIHEKSIYKLSDSPFHKQQLLSRIGLDSQLLVQGRFCSRKCQRDSSLLMPWRAQNCIFNAALGLIFLPERSPQISRSPNCCCKTAGGQGSLFLSSHMCWAGACVQCLSVQMR